MWQVKQVLFNGWRRISFAASQTRLQLCHDGETLRSYTVSWCQGATNSSTWCSAPVKEVWSPSQKRRGMFCGKPNWTERKKRCESLRAPHMLRDVEAMRYMQCEYHPPIGCPSLRTFDLIVFLLVFLVESDTSCSSWWRLSKQPLISHGSHFLERRRCLR